MIANITFLVAQMVKKPYCHLRLGLIPKFRKIPWRREVIATQYSCLEELDGGAW